MKRILAFLCCAVILPFAFAQAQNEGRPSPTQVMETQVGTATIKIQYGAPYVKNREIWGKLVPFGKVWRTGANEATTFETSADVKIEGQVLPKGKYGFFTLPGTDEWVLIFNKNAGQWGSYGYKQEEDVLRVTVRPGLSDHFQEQLAFVSHIDGSISIVWEKLEIIFQVSQ